MTPIASFACAIAVASLLCAGPAQAALQSMEGHVTSIETTYMPGAIALRLDVGTALCPVGKALWWATPAHDATNVSTVYSTMLAALLSGKKVTFIVEDTDSGCSGLFFYITAAQ